MQDDFPLLVDKMQACIMVGVSPSRFDAMCKEGILKDLKRDGRKFFRDEIRKRVNEAAGIDEKETAQQHYDALVMQRLNGKGQNQVSH